MSIGFSVPWVGRPKKEIRPHAVHVETEEGAGPALARCGVERSRVERRRRAGPAPARGGVERSRGGALGHGQWWFISNGQLI
jgi:hypothetical protein